MLNGPEGAGERCEWKAAGFSIMEVMAVIVMVAVVVGILTQRAAVVIQHARVNRAANVVAADFLLAQSLAGRQRRPVVVEFVAGTRRFAITDRLTSDTLTRRDFGPGSDLNVASLSATPSRVEVLPNALASATVTVTVGDASYQRQVRMSRAGQVRIIQ